LDSGLSHSVASYQQSSQQQSSSMQTSQMSSSQMTSSHVQEMSSQQTSSFSEQQTYSSTSSYTTQKSCRAQVPGWSDSPVLSLDDQREKEEVLMKAGSKLGVDSALDQLIAETSQETLLSQQEQKTQQMQSSSSVTTQIDSTAVTNESFSASLKGSRGAETPAEECRRSFEEAELEAMALETHSNASLSKQSSIVESASVQSFVFHKEEKSESESSFRSRKPLKSASTAFVRAPETFTHSQPPSCPTTPMSQRRRLRINQSPKPPADEESRPKYREGTESPFKPGFYRPPPEETTSSNPIFKLIRRNNSKTNLAQKEAETNPAIRISAASSRAYEADSES